MPHKSKQTSEKVSGATDRDPVSRSARLRYSWGSTRDNPLVTNALGHRRCRSNIRKFDFSLKTLTASDSFSTGDGAQNLGFKISESTCNLPLPEVEGSRKDDSFQKEVAQKTQKYLIGQLEAEVDVTIDRMVKKHGGFNEALLWVVANLAPEVKVHTYVNILLHRGAATSAADEHQRTALHYAVEHNYVSVTQKLLVHKASPDFKDKEGILPLTIALRNGNDQLASLLVEFMSNRSVRALFCTHGDSPAEFSCHDLIRRGLKKTVLSVFDCLVEQSGTPSQYRVYYHVLEGDEQGRAPNHPLFDQHSASCLQLIAKLGDKDIVYHDCVRLLLRKKWKDYAKWRFQLNALMFAFLLFSITFSLVTATYTPNPALYDVSPLQISRAVFECITALSLGITVFIELNQMRKNKLDYFVDLFNWLDIVSASLLLIVIPLRFLHQSAQWYVFSVGYLLWVIRVFKYATIFRQIGAYAQIIWNILFRDFIQFMVVFAVIMVAFSGSFVLALKGESMRQQVHSDNDTYIPAQYYWEVLFIATRTMIEGESVVNYTGAQSFGVFPTILMVLFLFMCLVVMLNILIAQLSDTYQLVQSDAQRGLELNRAWIVVRVEKNSIFVTKPYRIRYYNEIEEIEDPKDVLEKWESPALNDLYKSVTDMGDRLQSTELYMMSMRSIIARQERAMQKMSQALESLVPSDDKFHPGHKRTPSLSSSSSSSSDSDSGGVQIGKVEVHVDNEME